MVIHMLELEGLESISFQDQVVGFGNQFALNMVNSVSLVATGIGAPIVRVIYEGSTGKLGYHIAPITFSQNWTPIARRDLMGETLSPEQGREVITSTVNVVTMVSPIKSPIKGGKLFEKGVVQGIKTTIKKGAEFGMDEVVKASHRTEYEKILKDNTWRINERKQILKDHQEQLQIMKQNKDDYSQQDINCLYKLLDTDYSRLKTLRNERNNIINEQYSKD
jgi:hypothetical protein